MSAQVWMWTYGVGTTLKSCVLGQDASLCYFTKQNFFVHLMWFGYLVVTCVSASAGAALFEGSKEWCNN